MTDMRDDLDELGRRLWPSTDALRPSQAGARARGSRVRRFEPLMTLAAAALLVGVIGGAVALGRSLSSRTPAPAAPTAPILSPPVATNPPATASAAPSPSAAPAPVPQVIVWAAYGKAAIEIRVGSASGRFGTVASIPASTNPFILGAGGHRVLFSERTDGHIYDLDINTGVITDHGGGSDYWFYGGAFSPDGTRVAYVRQPGAMQAEQLRILDFSTGVITQLRTVPFGLADVPEVWTAAGIAASLQYVPYPDSPGPGFVLLDPSTGARIASTDAQVNSWAIASDGAHAAHSVGVLLPGQADPAILDTEVIGSAPQSAVRENTNHLIEVMAISPDGSTVLYSDDPTMGGYAGITLSPDYGLFTVSGGRRTQIAHYSGATGKYFRGLYLNATDYVVIAGGPNSAKSTLLESKGGGPLTQLDTTLGNFGSVFVVTGQ